MTLLKLPKELKLPENMIELLNGSSMFWLENTFFSVPLVNNIKLNEKICKINNVPMANDKKKSNSSIGTRFYTPRLFIKQNDKYTPYFVIQYANNRTTRELFNIKKPYLKNTDDDKNKYKSDIVFTRYISNINELNEEDKIMLKLDQIYMKTMELLFTCSMIGFKITNEKSDIDIITNICNFIKQPDGIKSFSDDYFNNNILYVYYKEDRIYNIINGEETIMDLFSYIHKLVINKNKYVLSILNEDYKYVINKNNCLFVPCMKIIRYENKKQQDYRYNIECRFRVNIQNDTTPTNFPDILLTKTPRANDKNHTMNYEEYRKIYTGGINDYEKAPPTTSYNCHIFISPSSEFALYTAGQPRLTWRINSLIYNKNNKSYYTQDYIDNSLFKEDEDDNENNNEYDNENTDDNLLSLNIIDDL